VRRVVESTVPTDGITVATAPGVVVVVDPARLEQVVANLVGNAVKHGRAPIEITAVSNDDGFELRVADSGDGADPDVEASLFQPFAAGPTVGSTGLGLWVVRTLVESHGGTVSYERVGGRPSFVVRLPSVAPDTVAVRTPAR
jgi:signal transduction histidine kinase